MVNGLKTANFLEPGIAEIEGSDPGLVSELRKVVPTDMPQVAGGGTSTPVIRHDPKI